MDCFCVLCSAFPPSVIGYAVMCISDFLRIDKFSANFVCVSVGTFFVHDIFYVVGSFKI